MVFQLVTNHTATVFPAFSAPSEAKMAVTRLLEDKLSYESKVPQSHSNYVPRKINETRVYALVDSS